MSTQEEIEFLKGVIDNINDEMDDCKKYASELGDTVKELLEILYKATGTKRFEEMRQEFIEYRSNFHT